MIFQIEMNMLMEKPVTNVNKADYGLKHFDTSKCELKISLEQDKHFYTNSTGINYYSCLLHNDIQIAMNVLMGIPVKM